MTSALKNVTVVDTITVVSMGVSLCFVCLQSGGQKDLVVDPKTGTTHPPQGCLQYILDCNGVAVGPKPVQAN